MSLVASATLPNGATPLLVRKLRQTKSVAECLEMVPDNPTQDVVVAALHVCGRHNDLGTAIELLNRYPSDSCLSLTISIAGKCGDYQRALKLLRSSKSSPAVASYHSCLAACGKAKAWRECLDLYESMNPSHRTPCSAGIVLTAMAKANRGLEALDFFNSLPNHDTQCVLKTITALVGSGDLEGARSLVEKHAPNVDMVVNRLISAYAKVGNWDMVKQLNSKSSYSPSFEPWSSLPKIGKGRSAYWKLGTFFKEDICNFTVALHPHRNPARNGIKLLLIENNVKVGFLLMQNTQSDSNLLGLFLDPNQRRKGLCKILLAIWMRLCLDAKISPMTGIMNKPLLCLSLQHTFGYTPAPNNHGVAVEISSSGMADGKIVIFSEWKKSVEGAFSPAEKEREGLIFTTEPPKPRGRIVHVKATFLPPLDLDVKVENALSSGSFDYIRGDCLKKILCGSNAPS